MPNSVRWISEITAWLFLATILVIGIPVFVCMPLWVDTTYHDLSARNILWGGVHYRDIFETNLPGMVWAHAVLRPIIGWSSEAIRIADLVVVGSSIVLLGIWLRRSGVPRSGQAWYYSAAAFFYVFETEFIHCQRDGWMLLPTVIALFLRGRQIHRAPTSSLGATFRRATFEGMMWACAVWVKPHSLVPALCVWLASIARLGEKRRAAAVDFAGLLVGGGIVGGLGSAWLIATGTWPYMWEVLLNWNGEYYNYSRHEINSRVAMIIMYFAPWSLIHIISMPVAIITLIRARFWRVRPPEGAPTYRIDQAILSALYIGWFLEAVFLQKTFHYSQAPVMLLAFAVVALPRPSYVLQFCIAWCLVGGAINHSRDNVGQLVRAAAADYLQVPMSSRDEWFDEPFERWFAKFQARRPHTYQQLVPRNKLLNGEWQKQWLRCIKEGSSPELKDELSFYRYIHPAPTWSELDEMRQYLATLNLKDGELVCWDDTTHPLYLYLGLRPSFRFMHVNTSMAFRSKRPLIREELIATKHKYVVSDMAVPQFLYAGFSMETPEGRDLDLPIDFPCLCREVYPYNQPIVFKAGRYFLHRVENPIEEVRIPYPVRIDLP